MTPTQFRSQLISEKDLPLQAQRAFQSYATFSKRNESTHLETARPLSSLLESYAAHKRMASIFPFFLFFFSRPLDLLLRYSFERSVVPPVGVSSGYGVWLLVTVSDISIEFLGAYCLFYAHVRFRRG